MTEAERTLFRKIAKLFSTGEPRFDVPHVKESSWDDPGK